MSSTTSTNQPTTSERLKELFAAAKSNQLGSWFTRTETFRKLTTWAFDVCDANHTKSINQAELYAGVLLVHLTMAKYAGTAACYPPERSKVDQLFLVADQDNSGTIDMKEFDYIMVILFNQIAGRIIMYYAFCIVMVPLLGKWVLNFFLFLRVDDGVLAFDKAFDTYAPHWMIWLVDKVPDSIWNRMPAQIISLLVFFFIIPIGLNKIDAFSFKAAKHTGVSTAEQDKETKTD